MVNTFVKQIIISFCFIFLITSVYAEEKTTNEKNLTINYSNISMLEYLKFVSRISGNNFIYNESDLNFAISVVSEEPITASNVMGTLIQILRMHNLSIIEEGNNLVIQRGSEVNYIAQVVTEKENLDPTIPLVTKIFRIKNADINSIASIIRQMISPQALLEVSADTRQLIITDITINVEKISQLIDQLDSTHSPLEIETYQVVNNRATLLKDTLNSLIKPISQKNPFILVPQENTNTLYIVSTPQLIEKSISILTKLDIQSTSVQKKEFKPENIFIYKPQNLTAEKLETTLDELRQNLLGQGYENKGLVETLASVEWIKETGSFLFSGEPKTIEKLKEILASMDTPSREQEALASSSFFSYTPVHKTARELLNGLKETVSSLEQTKNYGNQALVNTLKNAKSVEATNSILFTGNKTTFAQVRDLLTSIDIPTGITSTTTKYIIYKPMHVSGDKLEETLKTTASNLEKSDLKDLSFITSLKTARFEKETNSLYITGDQTSITQVQNLLKEIDTSKQGQTYFIYELKFVTRKSLDDYLSQIRGNLEKIQDVSSKEKQLATIIDTKKWVPESNSYMFTGSNETIKELQDLLTKYDVQTNAIKSSYFLYNIQFVTADILEDSLHAFAENLKKETSTADQHKDLIELIDNIRLVKETNSIMLTGTPQAIEQAKKLIADYDTKEAASKNPDQFFIYQPKNITAEQLAKYLKQTSTQLDKAGVADVTLTKSINTMKVNKSTNSIIFAGSDATLKKVKELLADVDTKELASLQDQNATFFIYKLTKASGDEVLKSLHGVSEDLSSLSKQSDEDKDFLDSLNGVTYVDKTNSLLFKGTPKALARVKTLVEKFDVSQLAGKETETQTYFVYNTKYVQGPELKSILENFAEKLKKNKVTDPNLFKTLQSIQIDETTHSLVFTGTPTALDKTKELLATFDVQAQATDAESAIAHIDDTSFLVYKLQYHNGEEIKLALRAIGRGMLESNTPTNQKLLDTISTIQLIPVTNQLLCSGTPDVLKRLKELIKNLDIPLKQVFIEMLIIETNFTNTLSFGLNWAGKVNYKNRGVAAVNNLPPGDGKNIPSMFKSLDTIDASNPPSGSSIPFGNGFDLGIIGDIVLHKGRTFLSLGSLVSALQQDGDTTIVSTPKLITQDSKTSEIFIGSNVPFVGSFVSNTDTNTLSTQNLEYRDIGISLALTPVLGNSDMVTLKLELNRSEQITDASGSPVQTTFKNVSVTGITTNKTTMDTTVHIPNKNFLVLTGMVDATKVRSKAGIPCLGGLPIIGAAFSEVNATDNNRNIVIFIRPHIISTYQDMVNITRTQEDFFRDHSGSVELESDFEEAMELIKSLDDE